jgi:hypothetical protein
LDFTQSITTQDVIVLFLSTTKWIFTYLKANSRPVPISKRLYIYIYI